jgi:hypothetical protein
LNASFGEMLKLQQITSGSNLVGKTVEFSNNDGKQSGKVDSMNVVDGKIVLKVGTNDVGLDSVTSVTS